MSQTVFGAEAVVTFLNRAFNNTSPSNLIFKNQVAAAGSTAADQQAFASTFGKSFASLSDAALATKVLTNMGVLPSTDAAIVALEAELATYFGVVGTDARGIVVLQLGQILANLEGATGDLAVYASTAAAWNNEVAVSYSYSANTANTATGDPLVGNSSTTGQSYVLTKSVDEFKLSNNKATVNNDTYIAAIDSTNAESNTLNTGDVIDGDAGTDTLNITRATNNWPTVTVKNIETLALTNGAAGNIDLSVFDSALTKVQSVGSASTAFIGANKAQELTVKDVVTTGYTTSVTYKSGDLTGAADTVKLNLNNVAVAAAADRHTVTLTGAAASEGVENLELNVTGGNAQLAALTVRTSAADSLKKIVVTGDKNLTLTDNALQFAGATGTGEVNASGLTGNLSLNLDNSDDVVVTGGAGNDTVLFGASLTSADKFDGGLGTDTLGANDFAALQAAFAAGRVSNVEAIRIQTAIATAGTLDVSKAGSVNAVTIAGVNAAVTLDKLADASTITLTAAGTGTLTTNIIDASLAGTANTLSVNLGTATDAATFAAGTITAAGVETINVAALGTVASGSGTNTLTITSNADLSKLVVTGSEDVSLSFGGSGLKTFDANAATGVQNTAGLTFSAAGAALTGGSKADVLTGGAGNDTIVGGAGNDTITGAAGSDVLTGGDGVDSFVMSDNSNAVNLTNPIVDTIKDFALGSGGDALNIAALANRPTLDGAGSLVKVASLTSALPATGTTDGRAELIVLDSTVTDLQAANASALNAKLFNLSSTGYGNVLVAYSDSATGNVRLATAVISGGDVTSVTDFAVLENVTTASLMAGFHSNNLAGLGTAGNTVSLTAAAANLTNALSTNASGVTSAFNDTITSTYAQLLNSTIDGGAGIGDTLNVSDAITAAFTFVAAGAAGATLSNVETINLQGGATAASTTLPNTASLVVNNTHATNAATVILGTGAGQTFNGGTGTGVDTVTLGAAGQFVTGGAGADIFNTTTAFAAGSTFAGSTGADTLNITDAGTTLNLSAAQLNSIETLTLTGATTITVNPAAALAITGGAGATSITGATAQTITVTQGAAQTLALAGVANYSVSGGTTGAITSTGTGTLAVTSSANNQTVTSASATTVDAAALNATLTIAGTGAFTVNNAGTVATSVITESAAATGALTVNAIDTNATTVTQVSGATGAFVLNALGGAGAAVVTLTALASHASQTINMSSTSAVTVAAASTSTAYTVNATDANAHTYVNSSTTVAVDTYVGGSAVDTVTLGLGGDKFTTGGGADVFNIAPTTGTGAAAGFNTSSAVPVQSQVINTATLDKITGMSTGVTIVTGLTETGVVATNGATLGAGTNTATDKDFAAILGTYNASADTFTVDTAGTSTLFVYDDNGDTAGGTMRAIVLVGYVDTGSADTYNGTYTVV